MPFTNFCCRSGGSNLNAGTRTGDTTEPGMSASFTYASGNWVQGTGVFTVASGDPASDGVAVGDFASVYADGSTVTGFVGRVTARDATTITVSLSAKAGTAPTDGTGNRTLKIGGAWLGPTSGSVIFPFGFVQNTLVNASSNPLRVNFKNDASFVTSASITHANAGPTQFEGYTTSYGDDGLATFDANGGNYHVMNLTATIIILQSLRVTNNATGAGYGMITNARTIIRRCVADNVRASGFASDTANHYIECEAWDCNKSASSTDGGFSESQAGTNSVTIWERCIASSNDATAGFLKRGGTSTHVKMIDCISRKNTGDGFRDQGAGGYVEIVGCDFDDNSSDCIELANTGAAIYRIENCNLIEGAGYGINGSGAGARIGWVNNCGYGRGTKVNPSGDSTGLKGMVEAGAVAYGDDMTPWVDPANGDYRINLAAAKGAGRGAFRQTESGQAGAVGFPDIGSTQHRDAPRPRLAIGI